MALAALLACTLAMQAPEPAPLPSRSIGAHDRPILDFAFDAKGDHLVTTGRGRRVRGWSTKSGERQWDMVSRGDPPSALAIGSDGRVVLAVPRASEILLVTLATGAERVGLGAPAPSGRLVDVALTPRGDVAWFASADGPLFRVLPERPEVGQPVPAPTVVRIAGGGVSEIALDRRGRALAVACLDGVVRVLQSDSTELELELVGHEGAVRCVAFAAKDRAIVSGGDDGTLRRWTKGKLTLTLQAHERGVVALAVDPKGRWYATGGGDGTIELFGAKNGERLRSIPSTLGAPVRALAFHPKGKELAAARGEATVTLFDLSRVR